MTRELKFRAWDSHQRIWVRRNDAVYLSANVNGDYKLRIKSGERYIVVQYTGLKDRYGVEIYEGDIIKAKYDIGYYDYGEVVYGRKGAFCIDFPKVGTGMKSPLLNYIHGIMFDESDIEVIGNIYENPALLEANS